LNFNNKKKGKKMEFDHIGLITNEKKGQENWVEDLKLWVTSAAAHPFKVEWLRFDPDSPIKGPMREKSHVAFKVDSLEEASSGLKVLLAPFEVDGVFKVAFYELEDGSVVELMEDLAK